MFEYEISISDINLFLDLVKSFNKSCNVNITKFYKNNIGLISYDDIIMKKTIKDINKYVIDGVLTYDKINYVNSIINKERNSSYQLFEHIVELSCSVLDSYIISFQFIKNRLIDDEQQYNTYDNILLFGDTLRYVFDKYLIKIMPLDEENDESVDEVIQMIKLNINPKYYMNHVYQNYIYTIAKLIYGNSSAADRFKSKSGFKSLVNNVHSLDKNKYSTKVLPYISNYYLCEKTDGKRVLCLIISSNTNGPYNYILLSDKIYYVNTLFDESILNSKYNITVLDAELEYNDKDVSDNIIYKSDFVMKVFDVLIYNNENVTRIPFEKRFSIMQKLSSSKILSSIGQIKKFIRLSEKNYNKEIYEFYESVKHKNIDGLIFTPVSDVQYKVFNQGYPVKFLNKNYKNMYCYKWKPAEQITIDFYIKKSNKQSSNCKTNNYILFSGINRKNFERNNMQLIDGYVDIIPEKYHSLQYFPIQFYTIDNPKLYEFCSKDGSLDEKIGEFNYINNEWNLVKIRTDRDVELERGEYYGNNYDIALVTWDMINNPMDIEDFKNDSLVLDNNYFKTNDNSFYLAQRNFNSFIKTYVLQLVLDKSFVPKIHKNWVIDLACGKGQDLFRISNMGFKNGLFIDNDKAALYEFNERKKGLSNKINMRINTKQVDLANTNYNDIIDSLNMIRLNQANLIICNLAIHYFIESNDMINNFISLINELINKNGIVIITCFDGSKIFELLNDSNEYNLYEDDVKKYSIIKDYKSSTLLKSGQKIKVLLPFSGHGEYYSEYLVNIDYLNEVFESKGFVNHSSESFDNLFEKYKNLDHLSDQDKEYVGLYRYMIYVKE